MPFIANKIGIECKERLQKLQNKPQNKRIEAKPPKIIESKFRSLFICILSAFLCIGLKNKNISYFCAT